jgi:E3 ubiquitin-protein ligase BRE1
LEERRRREVMEAELRRLESDLTRVRGNRDHLQQQLELRCSKDNAELSQHQEMRRIANTRKVNGCEVILNDVCRLLI